MLSDSAEASQRTYVCQIFVQKFIHKSKVIQITVVKSVKGPCVQRGLETTPDLRT